MTELITSTIKLIEPSAIPSFIIGITIIVLTYKVIGKFLVQLVAAHRDIANAVKGMAELLSKFIAESQDHRDDIISGLRVINKKIDKIDSKLDEENESRIQMKAESI